MPTFPYSARIFQNKECALAHSCACDGRFSITCCAGYCAVHLLCKCTTMLATSTLYAAVRIPAERICVIDTKFSITQIKLICAAFFRMATQISFPCFIIPYFVFSKSCMPCANLSRPSFSTACGHAMFIRKKRFPFP